MCKWERQHKSSQRSPVEVSVHPTTPRQMDPELRKGFEKDTNFRITIEQCSTTSASQGGLPGLTSVMVWGAWAINPAPNCVVHGRGE